MPRSTGLRRASSSAPMLHHLRTLRADQRGNVAIMMGLLLPALIGVMGLGFEISNWYMQTRAMLNAADSAAVAAATNGSSNYAVEAKAVAAQYGFVDGVNNVTVAVSNSAACPSGGNTCYSATISGLVPLYLSPVIGYRGDAVLSGSPQKTLTSSAVAQRINTPLSFCLLALGTSGAQGIRSNGAPNANMANCNVMSNTTATCNGGNLNATIGAAHGRNNGCGITQESNVPVAPDPYASLASNIPPNTCSSYPQEPTHPHNPPLPVSNQWSGSESLSGNAMVCGDLQLTGDTIINTSSAGAVLVIENGQLDTNGYTLKTSNGSGLTIVFSGTNGGGYTHYPTGGGTLDIAAPTTGNWKGVAIYQDPNLTSGVDISAAGNSPTWDITGLVYLPHSSVTFSGAVNKASNGQSCFVMVVDNVTVNGTGSILETGGCAAAGLSMPTTTVPARGQLVY
jgi:putative Flp pilus-assembly TadE/G-like protein